MFIWNLEQCAELKFLFKVQTCFKIQITFHAQIVEVILHTLKKNGCDFYDHACYSYLHRNNHYTF